MTGRESKNGNDLFYICSLIEYIARKTKNEPAAVIDKLGTDKLRKIYELADIYHSENIDNVAQELIEKHDIQTGNYDTVSQCKYSVPTHWDIGKVYKRLIKSVSEETESDVIETLAAVFSSKIVELIENYNSSFYYDSPSAIHAAYQNNCIPD